MDWIHWIGKSYYTMNSFKQEAEVMGVSRRADLRVAKDMNWGDTVYCAMLDGKTGVIFGSFTIDQIGGLSGNASKAIRESFRFEVIDDDEHTVTRGCGSYHAIATCAVKTTLPEMIPLLMKLKEEGVEIGKPMICGHFRELSKIRLKNLPFRQGFRKINAEALLHEATHNHRGVYGQFYVTSEYIETNEPHTIRAEGKLQEVEDYHKKKAGKKAILQIPLF